MRKGAAGSRACDPKFRTGVGSTFADVAYFKNAVGFATDGVFYWLLLLLLYHSVVPMSIWYDKIY